ncbi:MAG: 30S ribosomal protein S12 methylthiotransferase RimO [Magnetococcus sp. WYHC-3]
MAAPRRKSPRGGVGVISLGCPKNLVDTEGMLGRFRAQGHPIVHDPHQADILLVNTCGFIADAEEESRQAIAELAAIKAAHPGKTLVVTGCLAQRKPAELLADYPQIDLVLGSGQYDRLIPILESRPVAEQRNQVALPTDSIHAGPPRVLATAGHTAYLKIAEGCDNPCAFCIIPRLRGPFRSRHPDALVDEARTLVAGGVRELNLISQDTTLYGRDLDPRTSLAALLPRLAEQAAPPWIRLLYLYPTLLGESLLDVMAGTPGVLPYLDLPLQHAHGDTLKRMRRAERPENMRLLLERIRRYLPHAVIRTTFIVGFPGETEAEFAELERFVEEAQFDHVGVFCYSDEVEAPAHLLPGKVDAALAEERRDRLMLRQRDISEKRLAAWVGREVPLLVDGWDEDGEQWLCRTPGQAPEVDGVTLVNGEWDLRPGDLFTARITDAGIYDLWAEPLAPEEP